MIHSFDDALLKRAMEGDADAIEQLMQQCEKPVFNLALRVTGNWHDAADAAQEALIKIYRSLATFKGESAFSSWIYRITVNASLDLIRKRNKNTHIRMDDEDTWVPEPVAADDVQRDIEQKERGKLVVEAIGQLDEKYRVPLVLCEYAGMSYAGIAEEMGINEGTVKSRISRARSQLGKILQKQNIQEY
ncbi:RNA polymerase sigma factor [Eubacteriales bacterium OttesenSCG-928-N14]|nr:RNA polymerase sigma factor [Eubacteriales bacterium OttesenSCG-928-N14]